MTAPRLEVPLNLQQHFTLFISSKGHFMHKFTQVIQELVFVLTGWKVVSSQWSCRNMSGVILDLYWAHDSRSSWSPLGVSGDDCVSLCDELVTCSGCSPPLKVQLMDGWFGITLPFMLCWLSNKEILLRP